MLGCSVTPPHSTAEFVRLIEQCALIHGGEDWQYTALLGLMGVLTILMVPVVALIAFRKL